MGTEWTDGYCNGDGVKHAAWDAGVYALKSYSAAGAMAKQYWCAPQYGHESLPPYGVLGAVRLWGIVIEHERGYRAEHARIAGVSQIYPNNVGLLLELQQQFGKV
jgi:hypothetical protein